LANARREASNTNRGDCHRVEDDRRKGPKIKEIRRRE